MKIEVPVKQIKGLVLREYIASASSENEKYDISLSAGCIIFEMESSKEMYGVLLGDLLEQIIKAKSDS